MLKFAFGTIYERGVLNFKDRELITITSLLTQGGCENQLRVHIQASLNVGLTQEEIIETFIHYAPYVGFPRVLNAIFVAKEILLTESKKLLMNFCHRIAVTALAVYRYASSFISNFLLLLFNGSSINMENTQIFR